MTPFIAIFLVFIAVIVISRSQGKRLDRDLYKSKPLLTENEKEFIQALPDYHVFPQVALGALLQPNVKGNNRKYYSVRGTFAQKIADFVICDKELNVVAIVELDDKTHNSDKDAKRDAMLEQAGYRVVRWNSRKKPTVREISEKIIVQPF